MTPAFACDAFAEVVTAFCLWAEGEAHDVGTGRQLLLKLLLLVVELEPPDGVEGPAVEDIDLTASDWKARARRFADLPFQRYRTVYAPLDFEAEEPITGDLHDDFADIYDDLLRGLNLHRAGHRDLAAAHWAATHAQHWGRHATAALAAIDAHLFSTDDCPHT